jgi:hypothetical protein
MTVKELLLNSIYKTYKLCLENGHIKIPDDLKIYQQKIMYGISHNIPGTMNHIIYHRMNVRDKLEFQAHSKLNKFVI